MLDVLRDHHRELLLHLGSSVVMAQLQPVGWVWVMESGRKVDPIVFILHAQSSKIMFKVNADQLGAALFDQESDSVLLLN